ncbi:MAG: hypothetical protein WD035_04025 [Balneolaceae bacterium]
MIQLLQPNHSNDSSPEADQASSLSKHINKAQNSSENEAAGSSFARQLYGVLKQMMGLDLSKHSDESGAVQLDQLSTQIAITNQTLNQETGLNLQVRNAQSGLHLNNDSALHDLLSQHFQKEMNLTENQADKLIQLIEEQGLDFENPADVQKIAIEFLHNLEGQRSGLNKSTEMVNQMDDGDQHTGRVELKDQAGKSEGKSGNPGSQVNVEIENRLTGAKEASANLSKKSGSLPSETTVITDDKKEEILSEPPRKMASSTTTPDEGNKTQKPLPVASVTSATSETHVSPKTFAPSATFEIPVTEKTDPLHPARSAGMKGAADTGVDLEVESGVQKSPNISNPQNLAFAPGNDRVSVDGKGLLPNELGNQPEAGESALSESMAQPGKSNKSAKLNPQYLKPEILSMAGEGVEGPFGSEVVTGADQEEDPKIRHTELKRKARISEQLKEVMANPGKLMESHGLSFGNQVQASDEEIDASEKSGSRLQNIGRFGGLNSESSLHSKLKTEVHPLYSRLESGQGPVRQFPEHQNSGMVMPEMSMDQLAGELKSFMDGQDPELSEIRFLKNAEPFSQKIQQSVTVHSVDRNNFAGKLTQVIRQEIRNQQSTMQSWKSHQFSFEDGSRVHIAVRQMESSLQLQLGSMNSDLNRLIQTHANDIRQHLQEQMKLNVELHFKGEDSSGHSFSGQNTGEAGLANQRLKNGQIEPPDSTGRRGGLLHPSEKVRFFGFNRNEWTA